MKGKTIALWVLNVLLALLYLFASSHKIQGGPEVAKGFATYGLSAGFARFIGVCELLGAVGLLVPRTRFWAAVGLLPIMAGAVFMHFTHREVSHGVPAAVILLLVALSAYGRRRESGRIFARGKLLTGT